MGRIARGFEQGYPYLSNGGISYDWPSEDKERFNRLFREQKECIGGYYWSAQSFTCQLLNVDCP